MIDNKNHRLRIGDKLYHIYWEPIAGEVMWKCAEYSIIDIYYSDNCYAVLTNTKTNITHVKMLNHKELITWYYTKEEAINAIEKESKIPRAYAWGNQNVNRHPSETSKDVKTEENETPMYCEKSIKERDSFLKNLQNLAKAFKEIFK